MRISLDQIIPKHRLKFSTSGHGPGGSNRFIIYYYSSQLPWKSPYAKINTVHLRFVVELKKKKLNKNDFD